jgi:hypothetical protein
VIYTMVVANLFHLRVLLYEEPWLARTFPGEWPTYKSRVPRWLVRVPVATGQNQSQQVDLIGGHDRHLDTGWKNTLEARIHHMRARRACWFHKHYARRADLASHPRGDAVARNVPGMGQRVFFAQPHIRCQHWNALPGPGPIDIVAPSDQDTVGQSRRDGMSALIHCEDGHPMRGIVAKPQRAIGNAYGIGERPAPGHNQQRYCVARRGDLSKDRIEVRRSQHASAQLDHNDNSQTPPSR